MRDKLGRFVKGKPSGFKGKNHPCWKGGKITKKCLECGKEFKSKPSKKSKYCSRICLNNTKIGNIPWNKGKKLKENSGKNHWDWKGGRYYHSRGYIFILKPNHPFANCGGYVLQHRLRMEKYLGRYLKSGEVIHHINNNPSDNRIENLKLFRNNEEHMRFHDNFKNR